LTRKLLKWITVISSKTEDEDTVNVIEAKKGKKKKA